MPPPIGVVSGPLIPTRAERNLSTVSSGSQLLVLLPRLLAREHLVPADLAAAVVGLLDGGVEHAHRRLPDVAPGAVALDEGDRRVVRNFERAVLALADRGTGLAHERSIGHRGVLLVEAGARRSIRTGTDSENRMGEAVSRAKAAPERGRKRRSRAQRAEGERSRSDAARGVVERALELGVLDRHRELRELGARRSPADGTGCRRARPTACWCRCSCRRRRSPGSSGRAAAARSAASGRACAAGSWRSARTARSRGRARTGSGGRAFASAAARTDRRCRTGSAPGSARAARPGSRARPAAAPCPR